MAFTPKDMSGALFRNDKRDKDTQPNYRGNIMIEGVDYELSAWLKEGKNGKFMSLSAKRKEDRSPRQEQRPEKSYGDDFDGGMVPF